MPPDYKKILEKDGWEVLTIVGGGYVAMKEHKSFRGDSMVELYKKIKG